MRVEERADGKKVVVLERKDCYMCDEDGTRPKRKFKVCPKCNGTGKRGRGNCRECNDRHGYYIPGTKRPGYVTWYDHDDREPCERCEGNKKDYEPENWTDSVDVSFLPVVVYRSGRHQSWREENLGVGVYTVIDYGAHKTQTDEQLIEKIQPDLRRVQACKVVKDKESMVLADGILIVTASGGFSAVPYFGHIPPELEELRNA